jgi:inosine-uridine nucleoside N-ribohydrolase
MDWSAMVKVLIDTDPGIDDALAIMLAIQSGKLDVKAITTVSGNLTADRCSANARKILDLIGAGDIPVARGTQKPLARVYPKDPFSHGDDGLANLGLPASGRAEDPRFAADLIVETVNAHAGDITLIALGPLTNLALALLRDPELPRKVSAVVAIGGAYGFNSAGSTRATGDNPVSEWNIYVDPEAAKLVFEAGFALTAIGLDVATHENIELRERQRELLARSKRKSAWFLAGAVDFVEKRGFRSYCALIDALAVAAVLDPTIIRTQSLRVGIETRGELTTGQTVVDRREHFQWTHLPIIEAASEVNGERFLHCLMAGIA